MSDPTPLIEEMQGISHLADVRLALEQGGVLVGLGSWRPRYGRFRITTWEVR